MKSYSIKSVKIIFLINSFPLKCMSALFQNQMQAVSILTSFKKRCVQESSILSIFTKIVTLKGIRNICLHLRFLTSSRKRNSEQKTNPKRKSKHGHLHKQKPR